MKNNLHDFSSQRRQPRADSRSTAGGKNLLKNSCLISLAIEQIMAVITCIAHG